MDSATAAADISQPIAAPAKPSAQEVAAPANGDAAPAAAEPVSNGSNGAAETTNGNAAEEVVPAAPVAAVPEVKPRTVAAPAEPAAAAESVAEIVTTTAAIPELDIPAATHVTVASVVAEPAPAETVAVAAVEAVTVTEPIAELEIPAATHVAVVEPTEAPAAAALSVPETAAVPEPEPTEAPAADQLSVPEVPVVVAEPEPQIAEPVVVAAASPIVVAAPVEVPAPQPAPLTGLLGLPEYVQLAIKEVAAREGFTYFETRVEQGQNAGDGFVGEISSVKLIGTQVVNGVTLEDRDLSLIVKLPPSNAVRRQHFAMKLFEREVFVYTELLPAFARFQAEHGLRAGAAGFHSYPRCYHAHFDLAADQSVLILENLRDSGFAMESKFVSVKFEYARTVLEKLAELHGISLAMRQQRPEEFARFQQLADVSKAEDEQTLAFFRTMVAQSAKKAVAVLGEGEVALRERVERAAAAIVDEADRYKGENTEPYSVINHGDCWVNNMMFRHESGQSRQVSFYDWQCTRYSSPILDIVYFLFLCTDSALRARHYDDLIQAYHHALRAQLDRLGADVNELFPFTAMLRQLKQYGRFALGAALMVVPMLCSEKADLPDIDQLAEKLQHNEGKEWDGEVFRVTEAAQRKFAERMGGILRDMGKKGFF